MDDASRRSWQFGPVHHIGLTVRDIERSIVFYRDVLGFELIRRRPQVDNDYVQQQTGYPGVVLSVASFAISPHSPQSLEVVEYTHGAGAASDPATNRAGN